MKFAIASTKLGYISKDRKPYEGAEWEELGTLPNGVGVGCWTIEIHCLDDLMRLMQDAEAPLVLKPRDQVYDKFPYLEVYDDWRE
jgi:hypothetical protein